MADFVSSSLGITAVLAALEERKRTKVGQTVDCSLAEGCKYFSKLISHNYKEDGRGKIQIGYITFRNKQYCLSSSKGSEIEKTLKNS
jgi:crotonobetainyl-CoA:carnitine CoA-transferase CaiB-like acyl-CoA transferase